MRAAMPVYGPNIADLSSSVMPKTADAVSPNLTAGSVWLTMIGFTSLYLLLAIAALYIALRHIRTASIPAEGRDS